MFLRKLREKIILWTAWKEIKQLKDKKGFIRAGIPSYNRLFGRDSLISSWQLLDMSPGICKATLEILSRYQGKVINREREEEPGKILHETDLGKSHHKSRFPLPYYGSIDSTPLFLIIFSFYYKKTKDIKFLNYHWDNILRALNWIEEYGDMDKDLFLEYERKNPVGLFHQGWKDGFRDHLKINPPVALVEVQGYQYLALKEIAELAKIKEDFDLANKLLERAEKLKEKFNRDFWMPKENYFALALDGKKEQREAVTSNVGHLLFTGIMDDEKVDLVIKRIFSNDMWTPYGIRTLSTKDPDFDPKSYHLGSIWPHDNWIIAQGLRKLGMKSRYQKIKDAILLADEKIGYLPELYGVVNGKVTVKMEVVPCHPQAWATGSILNFLETR